MGLFVPGQTIFLVYLAAPRLSRRPFPGLVGLGYLVIPMCRYS